MATKMSSSTSSKVSRSRTKDGEASTSSLTSSRRLSSIPTPTSSKSSIPTTSSRSRTLKATSSKIASGLSRPISSSTKDTPKAPERRFPLYSGPESHERDVESRPTINTTPLSPQQRLRRKQSSKDHRTVFARSSPSLAVPDDISNGQPETKGLHSLSYDAESAMPSPPISTAFQASISSAFAPEMATSQSRMQSFITSGPQPPLPIKTPELKPPTPGFMRSHSASTGLSDSPGPFSHYSRESTPTSISSASPAMSQIPKFPSRIISTPTKGHTPVTRRKMVELSNNDHAGDGKAFPSVTEQTNPISMVSIVKSATPPMEVQVSTKKKVLRKSPPNPPQRVSSKTKTPDESIDRALASKDSRSVSQKIVGPSKNTSANRSVPAPASTITKTSATKTIPTRPSRDGTPSLEGFGRSPVVQSNLGQLSTVKASEAHQSSVVGRPVKDCHIGLSSGLSRIPSETSAVSKQEKGKFSLPQPSITSPHLISRDASRSRNPSIPRKPISSRESSRDPSPAISSSSKTLSRFGLFAKKLKSPSETTLPVNNDKNNRKGPAAGTGHEGYGRYGRRGRSSSTSTAASRARSTSIESNTVSTTRVSSSRKSSFNSNDGRPELDDFLKDRLEPVVIGGGGQIKENRNSSANYSVSSSLPGSTLTLDSLEQPRVLYRQDSQAYGSTASMADSIDSVASGVSSIQPQTLAHRRSLHRAQLSGERSGMKVPAPINTKKTVTSSGPATYDSTLSTAPPTDASGPLTDVSEGREGNWLRPIKKTLTKPKRSHRWNIFHRRQRSIDSIQETPLSRQSSNEQHALGISGLDAAQPVAHYALSDDFESDGPDTMEQKLRTIEDDLDLDMEDYTSEVEAIQTREPSVLLPSPPKFPPHFETYTTLTASAGPVKDFTNVAINRQPRLQHVGRIPPVVPRQDRVHRPSPQSFSRPFARPTDAEESPDLSLLSQFPQVNNRPKLGLQTTALSGAPIPAPFEKSISAPPTNGMLHNLDGEQEFLHFSPRKWSEVSTANSSVSMSLAAITAMISSPDAILSDDEVWGEFDDFLDQVTSPVSASPRTPGLRAQTDYFAMHEKDIPNELHPSSSNSVTTIDTAGSDNDDSGHHATAKQGFLIPPASHNQLNSPLSLTDLYANYGDRDSTAKSNARDSTLSTVSGSRYSSQSQMSRSGSRSSITSGHTKRFTQVMAEKMKSPSSDSLRFSALMTSRWLSFDRVLFSPIQDKMKSTRQDRILVVDGLGNDDWSTYCALTFPNASVHSLSSLSSRSSQYQRNPDNWTSPTNHRRHTYTDVNAPFPFVKHWFSAVVFRFPAANTSMAYRHAISECERVLRPGGYLELSVLDMDMVNMGSRTSHAVRSLKMHVSQAKPEISLSPVSDEILKLLGKKGFENVSRAIVGVPVAGYDSGSPTKRAAQSPQSTEESRLSLGDMLADQAKSQDLHYPSTRAMSKAARWWWSKCYENVTRHQASSIWDNEQILHECEERETGLKLFVCYAQKPVSPPRRTVSV